jgi:GntR family transcriptional regulator
LDTGTKSAQVRHHVMELVEGRLSPHDKLPTERELAEELAVSRLTVRRVLDGLEHERRVYRIQGAGTFVSESHIAKSLELTSFTEDMRSRGMVPGSRLLAAEETTAGARLGQALALSPSEKVLHIARVRTADGEPICLEHSYVPSRLAPGLLDLDLEGSLYDVLFGTFRLRLEHADQTITATVVEPVDAELLNVPAFSPAFNVERTGYDPRGRAIERAESLYRGDRYSYHVTLYRRHSATNDPADT